MKTMLPSLYTPTSPEEFIGPAAKIAKLLQVMVAEAIKNDKTPMRLLLNGEPGVGKSALAKYFMRLLGCHPQWSTTKLSGTQIRIETVEEIANSLHYKDLFGGYRLIWIEEADAVPAIAQVRFLTLLDDLPNGCAVVCTSNCKLEDFKRRFETRFRVLTVDAPEPEEISALLSKWPVDPRALKQISTFACGNVRAALLDAESALQAAA